MSYQINIDNRGFHSYHALINAVTHLLLSEFMRIMQIQERKIRECAEVLAGFVLKTRAEHEPDGVYQVIVPGHVPDGSPYTYADEHELRMTLPGSPEKYRVCSGDVLFISRGTRNCAAVIASVPEPAVASATFYVLRANANVDPAYLAWFLNQPPAQAQIAQIRTGAGTPIVQRNKLGDLLIPVPSMQDQKRIAELATLQYEEVRLWRRLLVATENRQRLLGHKIMAELGRQ